MRLHRCDAATFRSNVRGWSITRELCLNRCQLCLGQKLDEISMFAPFEPCIFFPFQRWKAASWKVHHEKFPNQNSCTTRRHDEPCGWVKPSAAGCTLHGSVRTHKYRAAASTRTGTVKLRKRVESCCSLIERILLERQLPLQLRRPERAPASPKYTWTKLQFFLAQR